MRNLDLPLNQTAVSRLLPWIMAGLLYLSIVALATAAIADGALSLFSQRDQVVTVSLPTAGLAEDGDRRVQLVLDALNQAAEVTSASILSDDEVRDLIDPYYKDDDLLLPRLIDVKLDPVVQADLDELERQLRAYAPDATIGVQIIGRGQAERQASFFRIVGVTLGGVLLLGALAIVALITSLSLAMHNDTVSLLRYMGAQDGYLARQFERYALLSGLKGGLIAFFAAMLTILLLLFSIQNLGMVNSALLGLRPVDWIFLACVPVVSALLCTVTARITALWGLGRMP